MRRRDFLKAAAVGVGAAGTQSGCAAVRSLRPELFSPERIDTFLDRFDHGLSAVDRGRALGPLASANGEAGPAQAMTRRALRTLFAVGALADLEVEEQAHPGVQARIARMLPEMETSLGECTAFLDGAAPQLHAQARQALRARPELPLQLAEAVDEAGGEAGVSASTRRKFRALAMHVGFRMRHHDPAVVAGEYVAKVRKIEGWSADEARLQRHIGARIGREALLADGERFAAAQARWAATLGAAPAAGRADDDAAPAIEEPWKRPLRGAAWCFGLGAVAGGIGAIMVSSGTFAGVFPITVGAILLVSALVMLLAAGFLAAADAAKHRPDPDPEATQPWTGDAGEQVAPPGSARSGET